MHEIKEFLILLEQIMAQKLITIQGVKLSLGNIIFALIFLLMSNRAARFFSRFFIKKLVNPFIEDKSIIGIYQSFAFYAFLALNIVFSLTVAGIPLTIFTVIGGALAIGVGFGSQNIVNNFISGIILMLERPIKNGDIIEINGLQGRVIGIGTRSTKLKSVENKYYIIPNSAFLENHVLNWTLGTSIIRTDMTVGVSYDADPKTIIDICTETLKRHPMVDRDNTPFVVLDEFADSSINYKLFFWADIEKVNTLSELKSDIRIALYHSFKSHGIDIPFPQRVVHIKEAQTNLGIDL